MASVTIKVEGETALDREKLREMIDKACVELAERCGIQVRDGKPAGGACSMPGDPDRPVYMRATAEGEIVKPIQDNGRPAATVEPTGTPADGGATELTDEVTILHDGAILIGHDHLFAQVLVAGWNRGVDLLAVPKVLGKVYTETCRLTSYEGFPVSDGGPETPDALTTLIDRILSEVLYHD